MNLALTSEALAERRGNLHITPPVKDHNMLAASRLARLSDYDVVALPEGFEIHASKKEARALIRKAFPEANLKWELTIRARMKRAIIRRAKQLAESFRLWRYLRRNA